MDGGFDVIGEDEDGTSAGASVAAEGCTTAVCAVDDEGSCVRSGLPDFFDIIIIIGFGLGLAACVETKSLAPVFVFKRHCFYLAR